MEPSTKGPAGSGGAELFLLLGTSDEGSLGAALLEARGVGVEVLPLGVAILASPPSRSGFRSHQPAAPTSRSRAICQARDAARDPVPRLRSHGQMASAGKPRPGPGTPARTRTQVAGGGD